MHTKIIDPKNSSNKAIYDNKGSSARAINYMNKENADKNIGIFFNEKEDNILHDEVIKKIDSNVNGLKEDESKFDSIVVSPSNEELLHIGNDQIKLKEFVCEVMKNYSNNFNSKQKNYQKKEPVILLDFGSAKYKFDQENKESFFVKFKDSKNVERYIWGIDLKRTMENSNVVKGDKVHIDHLGQSQVKVMVKEKQADGRFIEREKTVLRNEWEVVTDDYRKQVPLKIKDTPKMEAPELVWYAAIHNTREYELKDEKISLRITDLKKQGLSKLDIFKEVKKDMFLLKYKPTQRDIEYFYDNGPVMSGEIKPGDNRHIHIIVSRRDKEMKRTLNNSNRNSFNRVEFFERNSESFNMSFNFTKSQHTLFDKRWKMFQHRIDHMNLKYAFPSGYLDSKKLFNVYADQRYHDNFSKNFWKLENGFKKGTVPADPIAFVALGSNRIPFEKENNVSLADMMGSMKSLGGAMGEGGDQEITLLLNKLRRRRNQRSQDQGRNK
ncbi:DUF5712 family protein [Pedobacter nutrimenti]|uniref:Uncharacterized protein n=1 Tax=Pedobacter nutrimenti TaxID=1241337 RepID=A0A318U649_9SPHI|nr:DUF5712 family protein [Pedobacter nutrimenti]PYF68463.1 hypothetical protein B0O44_11250 [Pedobacter nutrimenti]